MDYRKLLTLNIIFLFSYSYPYIIPHEFLDNLTRIDLCNKNALENFRKEDLLKKYCVQKTDIFEEIEKEILITPISFVISKFASYPYLLKGALRAFREKGIYPDELSLNYVIRPLPGHENRINLRSVKLVAKQNLEFLNDIKPHACTETKGTPLHYLATNASEYQSNTQDEILEIFEYLTLLGAQTTYLHSSSNRPSITTDIELFNKMKTIYYMPKSQEARKILENTYSKKNIR